MAVAVAPPGQAAVAGLLRIDPDNPRYLTNDTGEAILLVGPHTWHVFQDYDDGKASTNFDYSAWLDGLERDGFTFFRGWTWSDGYYSPIPFEQVILQGRRIYDLSRWNERYFERLRERIQTAADRGLYTSVLLFQGLSVDDKGGMRRPSPWAAHPLNRVNNIQNLNARAHAGPRLAPIHEEYLRQMVDALWDLDNFIWEVGNGLDAGGSPWIQRVTQRLRSLEATKASEGGNPERRHLIWASCVGDLPMAGAAPGADLISPCNADRYGVGSRGKCFEPTTRARPPAADGRRVVVSDSSRLSPLSSGQDWAWKSFFRGLHPIALTVPEGSDSLPWWRGRCDLDRARRPTAQLRKSLAAIARIAAEVELAYSVPQASTGPDHGSAPASTGYALFTTEDPATSNLADGEQFLVYQPPRGDGGAPVTVCGLEPEREYRVVWRRLEDGQPFSQGRRRSPDGCATFPGTARGGILALTLR